nr:hypothetical protein [Tanacetum cinerariifolium]
MHDTDEPEPAEVEEVLKVVTAAKLMTEVVTTVAPITTVAQVLKPSALRKRRGIPIEEPKPVKRQAQIKQDEAFVRQLEAELNANINWNDVLEQARKNMMIYLKNMAGFKMDFFKGMTYNEIRPIFKKHYNSIRTFLEKEDEEVTVQEKRQGEHLEQDTSKKQRIDEEAE